MPLFWIATLLSSAFGGYLLFETMSTATGAPQQAAGAAMAMAFAVIPYVFTRCMAAIEDGFWRGDSTRYLKGIRDDHKASAAAVEAGLTAIADHLKAIREDQAAHARHEVLGWCPACGQRRVLDSKSCVWCGIEKPAVAAKPDVDVHA